jgi:hypothetical protein
MAADTHVRLCLYIIVLTEEVNKPVAGQDGSPTILKSFGVLATFGIFLRLAHYLNVMNKWGPAGLENAKGILSSSFAKDPTDPARRGEQDVDDVAGHDAQQHEDDDRDPEQAHEHQNEAPHDMSKHLAALLAVRRTLDATRGYLSSHTSS